MNMLGENNSQKS